MIKERIVKPADTDTVTEHLTENAPQEEQEVFVPTEGETEGPIVELKRVICDEEYPLGTDELLAIIAEFFDDEDITKVINEHIQSLDETWRYVLNVQEMLKNINKQISKVV